MQYLLKRTENTLLNKQAKVISKNTCFTLLQPMYHIFLCKTYDFAPGFDNKPAWTVNFKNWNLK